MPNLYFTNEYENVGLSRAGIFLLLLPSENRFFMSSGYQRYTSNRFGKYGLSVFLLLFLPVVFFYSCRKEYRFELQVPEKTSVKIPLEFHVREANGREPDSIVYLLDSKEVTPPVDISSYPLGKHNVAVKVFFDGKSQNLSAGVVFLAAEPYKIYDFDIIHSFPHDYNAYTQGLEYHGGYLYESTGRKGQSSLRKVAVKTGEVLQKTDVPDTYFAEGMTIWKDKIFQLTWQSGKGFIYDKNSFEKTGEFAYGNSREGWGLTHDDKVLYKSDGTEKIWILDPVTFEEKGFISCYTHKAAVRELNELEFINGKIYANVWMKNVIIIIDPATGTVEGVADMNALVKAMSKTQHLSKDDVLNGIAYDAENDRLFVTGKYWGELFEIKLKKRN